MKSCGELDAVRVGVLRMRVLACAARACTACVDTMGYAVVV